MIINPFVLFKEFNMYLVFSTKINSICEESKLLMNIIAMMIIQVTLRGFAKLKQFQKSKKIWMELNPPTHPPIQIFFGGKSSVTRPEHSNLLFCDSRLQPRDCRFSFIAWNSVLASDTLQRYCNVISENCNIFFDLK